MNVYETRRAKLKCLVLGAASAGKTSILRRYFYHTFEAGVRVPTKGEYLHYTVRGEVCFCFLFATRVRLGLFYIFATPHRVDTRLMTTLLYHQDR